MDTMIDKKKTAVDLSSWKIGVDVSPYQGEIAAPVIVDYSMITAKYAPVFIDLGDIDSAEFEKQLEIAREKFAERVARCVGNCIILGTQSIDIDINRHSDSPLVGMYFYSAALCTPSRNALTRGNDERNSQA